MGVPASASELQQLPPGAASARTDLDVIVIFATKTAHLAKFATLLPTLADRGGLWVSWPKKTSKVPHELEFGTVQATGLKLGLVDNKICRIDDDWQAMRFVRRVKK